MPTLRTWPLIVAVAALVSPASAADPAIRAEIEQSLQQMAAAALAADADGYLAHVYTGDTEFLNEQKYFANDLKRKAPAELSFELGDVVIGDGTAEALLTMAWTMPDAKPRSVAYGVRFIQSDGVWFYAGEVWQRHEAPGVIVMCAPGLDELADQAVEAFNAVRAHVEEGFQLEKSALPKRTQKVKLYGSMKHLQASICLAYEDSLGGWNEPGESIKLLTSRRTTPAHLRNVLAHEYGHVATFELGDKARDIPWWAIEGVAELSAEKFASRRESPVPRWAKAGRLAPWDEITDFNNTPDQWGGHVYRQGHHMISYISDRFGREGRNAWFTAMANGKTINEACLEVFKIDFAQLDTDWRAAIPEPAEPKKDESQQKDQPAEPGKPAEPPK